MNKTKLIISLTAFLLVAIALSNTTTAAVYNNRTGTSYTTIQTAINKAQPGDTIIVTGTYTENIEINKKITLKANGTATIKPRYTDRATVRIISTGSGTTITGFTVTKGLSYGLYGIKLFQAKNCKITNNKVINHDYGIYLYYYSSYNTIYNNKITNNKRGIVLEEESNNNKVYRNSFISNGMQAMVYYSSGNIFNLAKPTGGNYWSDYTGKDSNWDGFGDTAYLFTGGQDRLPLVPPKIIHIYPANGLLNVPLNKTIDIIFNQYILAGPGYNKITVKLPNGTAKAITKWISGNKLYIKAKYGWNPGTTFIVTIPANAIKNKAGSILQSDFKSSFVAAIKVKSIDPANGVVNVPKTKTIVVTFSNNILAGPDYNKITVKTSTGTTKTITKWISGNKLYIKATSGWNPGVKFIVTIPKNAVKNSAGSMLATDFKSSFTAAK